MQLKNSRGKITGLLATATCSLLNQGALAQTLPGWYIDSAVLAYDEKDRITAIEPVVSITRVFDDERILNFKLTLDSLTGASPNGATISNQVQTFARPSGRDTYTTAAGDLPLDDTFKDSRSAVSVQYQFPLDRLTRISAGLAFSEEYDYQSLGFNVSVARDFNNKNTTVSLGLAFASDTIDPEGNIPIPFAPTSLLSDAQPRLGVEDEKTITDILFGVTQVINRRTLMQFNYSFSSSDGYLIDPYKILSEVDGVSGETLAYRYENRPDSRAKHSLYWKTKYSLDNGNIIDFSYRYLWDDWDIASHTADFRYRVDINDRFYVEPHLRYYTQEAANFYTHSLVSGQALPAHASADPRLGAFDGIIYGAKVGYRLNGRSEISLRLELYDQNGDTVGNPIGIQNDYDLFPDLEATIVQFSYSYRF